MIIRGDRMHHGRRAWIVAVATGVGVVLLMPGCQNRQESVRICSACQRPVHAHSATVGLLGDRKETFCCPACALAARSQEHRHLTVLELTDYRTGGKLRPDAAYVVAGSEVSMCAREAPVIDAEKRPHPVHFDRCLPSILAFPDREAAASFASEHGGRVARFDDLAAAAQ